MRVGRTRRPWVKNCIAIGLSGGFIEPLESTAIYMIEMSVRWLLSYFPDKDFAEPLSARYNEVSARLYDEVRDFICLHYALGNRSDSQYWIDAREALQVLTWLRQGEDSDTWRRYVTTVRRQIGQTTAALPDHRTLLTVLRGELDPARLPQRPPAGKLQGVPPGTVPLPGQAAPLQPRISLKQRRR
jgi:hypothetical protein